MATELPILPGAEPWSADGTNGHGVLCLHGFTGNPSSMRGVAQALHGAGFAVELPRLPGHGTTVEDMLTTTWSDWSAEAERAFGRLSSRVDRVLVAGLSMGGTLTCWLASRHPEISGIVCVNPLAESQGPEAAKGLRLAESQGVTMLPGIGSDVADPSVTESAYDGVPLKPLLSLLDAVDSLDVAAITCPLLLFTSPQDHVVDPHQSDHVAASVSGPVERVTLERSYHVATIDYDRDTIFASSVAFASKVVGL